MAFVGLVSFEDLLFYYKDMSRITHIGEEPVRIDKNGVFTSAGTRYKGDVIVVAIDALRIGPPSFSTVEEAELLYKLAERANAVRFVVDVTIPPYELQDIAIAIKTAWPRKDVSIHVLSAPQTPLLNVRRLAIFGIEVSDTPPPDLGEELHVEVPSLEPHPLARGLYVGPLYETQYSGIYLIGETSLIKMGVFPTPLAILQQTALLSDLLLSSGGYVELDPLESEEPFLQITTSASLAEIPLIALKSVYNIWADEILGVLGWEK
jgi:hypothetical protein